RPRGSTRAVALRQAAPPAVAGVEGLPVARRRRPPSDRVGSSARQIVEVKSGRGVRARASSSLVTLWAAQAWSSRASLSGWLVLEDQSHRLPAHVGAADEPFVSLNGGGVS